MGELLEKIYYDVSNPGSFGGVEKLFQVAKKLDRKITKNQVREWLKDQDVYSLHRRVKRKFPRLQILVDDVDEQWQADLMDMQWFEKENDGVKYLLTIVDVLSRFAWVLPIKDKKSKTLVSCFTKIFDSRIPEKIQTDQGKEFKNSEFISFLKEKGIIFFTTTDDAVKCAIVERFNRTLRTRIYRYVFYKGDYRYIDDLQKIVDAYNDSYHRTIRMSPREVNRDNRLEVMKNISKLTKPLTKKIKPLAIGEYVRIARKKPTFEKGSTANFSYEVYIIYERKKTDIGFIYKLKDLRGEEITSHFYQDELVVVNEPKLFKVEQIIEKRYNRKKKKYEYLVKFIGYSDKFNAWVDEIE